MTILLVNGNLEITDDYGTGAGKLCISIRDNTIRIECEHDTGEGWDAGITAQCSYAQFVELLTSAASSHCICGSPSGIALTVKPPRCYDCGKTLKP